MGSSQQFSLRWNNYLHHITSAFESLRSDLDLVDVTLSCEGKKIKAHKMLLSACSTYFKDLFKENPCQHPVIVFRNVNFSDLEALIDFMYQGEVNVVQEQLASFLTTAELLAVQGLTDGNGKDLTENLEEENSEPAEEIVTEIDAHSLKRTSSSTNSTSFMASNVSPASPPVKRKKWNAPVTSATTSQKTRNDSNETHRITKTSLSSGGNTVDIIPVMPQVKVELPEFIEPHADDVSYNNTEADENPLDDISSLEHKLTSGAGGSKEESLDIYGGSSSDTGEITGEQMTPAEISEVLAKAGPSNDGSQDSLQDGNLLKHSPYFTSSRQGEGKLQEARVLTLDNGQFGCSVCDKEFQNLNSCYGHLHVHSGATVCNICNYVLSRKGNFKRHMRTVHGINDI